MFFSIVLSYIERTEMTMTSRCYRALIHYEGHQKNVEHMLKWLHQLLTTGWRPSSTLLHFCIDICIKHSHHDTSSVMRLLQLLGHRKSSSTFAIMLQCCKSRQDVDTLLLEMKRCGIFPNRTYWLALIQSARVWDTRHELYEILDYYHRTTKIKVYDNAVYNGLISHLLQQQKLHGAMVYLERASVDACVVYAATHLTLLHNLIYMSHTSKGHVWKWWTLLYGKRCSSKMFRYFFMALSSKKDFSSLRTLWKLLSKDDHGMRFYYNHYQVKIYLIQSLAAYNHFDEAWEMLSQEPDVLMSDKGCIVLWRYIKTRSDLPQMQRLLHWMAIRQHPLSQPMVEAMEDAFLRLFTGASTLSKLFSNAVVHLLKEVIHRDMNSMISQCSR
jgi:hypothetical protein